MRNIFTVKINPDYRSDRELRDLINNIDLLINSLNTEAIKNIGNTGVAEYELDTGQTRIKKKFTTTSSIIAAVKEYETLRQFYVNKLNKTTGRYTLMGSENFKNKKCR